MKKRENLWQLLKRLDEEAGQFNLHLKQANRYFDNTAKTTNNVLENQEKELHKLIAGVKKSLETFLRQKEKKKNNK